MELLQEFDLTLCFTKRGKYNIVAGALSRICKLIFASFKSELLESLRGLCGNDSSFLEV